VPEAEALVDQELPVLDKGFVRLVDYLGGDRSDHPPQESADREPSPPFRHRAPG
jgi:hypothetical protein